MQSIKTIYKIGPGPSSSHTFGPMMASKYINEQYPEATNFKITLFGSLALTGKGHLTDKIILKTLGTSKCEIIFDMKTPVEHPNTMIIEVFDKDTKIAKHTFVSIGGGKIEIDGKKGNVDPEIYPHTKMDDIQVYCNERHLRLDQYIDEVEDSDFDSYMNQIFKQIADWNFSTSFFRSSNLDYALLFKPNLRWRIPCYKSSEVFHNNGCVSRCLLVITCSCDSIVLANSPFSCFASLFF